MCRLVCRDEQGLEFPEIDNTKLSVQQLCGLSVQSVNVFRISDAPASLSQMSLPRRGPLRRANCGSTVQAH